MFTEVRSPTGHFSLLPFPSNFFETPPPFGAGGLLVLNRFKNNSADLLPEHLAGIQLAAGQANLTFGVGSGACEVYGITDRTGSEDLNRELSSRRARGLNGTERGHESSGWEYPVLEWPRRTICGRVLPTGGRQAWPRRELSRRGVLSVGIVRHRHRSVLAHQRGICEPARRWRKSLFSCRLAHGATSRPAGFTVPVRVG